MLALARECDRRHTFRTEQVSVIRAYRLPSPLASDELEAHLPPNERGGALQAHKLADPPRLVVVCPAIHVVGASAPAIKDLYIPGR